MKCKNRPIGVCSWSLQTDIDGVANAMKSMRIEHVHLTVGKALQDGGDDYVSRVKKQDWTITASMIDFPQEDYSTLESIKVTGGIMPDEFWRRNLERYTGAAEVTAELGVRYLSLHAGFIDESDISQIEKFHERIKSMADIANRLEIMLLLETGQETALELRKFLKSLNHPAVGVNFDPANMILYDKGEPVEAVKILAPWIKHIHIKDAIRTSRPGTWGQEVPWGEGQVGSEEFLSVLDEIGYNGALAIEREAGNDRFGDIKLAADRLKAFS